MPVLSTQILRLLRNPALFCQHAGGITLRSYQLAPALAVIDSVLNQQGRSFVIIFPRQSGKSELQAQIQAYLLTAFSQLNAAIVAISPTYKPQTFHAMRRLESVLKTNLVSRDRWSKSCDDIYQVGKARCYFLSGSPAANIIGAAANLLLSVDEAQDILIDKFDKDIAPMAAGTNATRVLWGTAWTGNTLLAREEAAALARQREDGVRRVWRLTADHVAAEVPSYGRFVADQVAKLGRNHPLVRTQYCSEDIDTAGGLFPPERMALIYGNHPSENKPGPGSIYVMTLNVAGEDEAGFDGRTAQKAGRDAAALTMARVNLAAMRDPAVLAPTYEIVFRRLWVGVTHTEIYAQVLSLASTWEVRCLVCDATGVGAGLTSFLEKSLGSIVIPFTFNAKTKSTLGWDFLSLIDTGRLKTYSLERPQIAPDVTCPPQGELQLQTVIANEVKQSNEISANSLSLLHALFIRQLEFCQYEIIPGPEKQLRWGVSESARDPASGALLHDDLIISAALLSVLDGRPWNIPGQTILIPAPDPLEDMKRF